MERSKTELKLIETGKNLFWKYGIKRVSVEELCKKAELSKMSFYRVFKNKLDLAKIILDIEMVEGVRKVKEVFDRQEPFVDKLERIILLKMENSDNISMEFLQDLMSYGGEEFQGHLHTKSMEMNEILMEYYKVAQLNGEIRQDLNLDLIPLLSENIRSLARNEQLMHIYKTPQEVVKELTTFFFYGIVPHPNHP